MNQLAPTTSETHPLAPAAASSDEAMMMDGCARGWWLVESMVRVVDVDSVIATASGAPGPASQPQTTQSTAPAARLKRLQQWLH